MKKLILIGGVPGVGKTAVADQLNKLCKNSVWLDGDWCWKMDPWNCTEENKRMVEKNIYFILNNYINNKSFDNIIFSWVLHTQFLIDKVLSNLELDNIEVYKFSLICDADILEKRMSNDNRSNDQIVTSIEDSKNHLMLETTSIDVSIHSAHEVASLIIKSLKGDDLS